MPVRTSRRLFVVVASALLLWGLPTAVAAQVQLAPPPLDHLAGPPALSKLLPTLEGWTRSEVRTSEVAGAVCNYTLASATYTNGDTRLKLTLADTGGHAENLMALAPIIASLPDGYDDKVPPATTIKRMKTDGSPASELWDAAKLTGEVTVLVAGRFLATVEAQQAESPAVLRALLAAVDLKALAALK